MHPHEHPSFFDRQLLTAELEASQASLDSALDRVHHWGAQPGLTDELALEDLLADIRLHAHTVRTVTRLIRAQLE